MSNQAELQKQVTEAHAKYSYFLMAVAASAIAICVSRTTGRPLEWPMLPLGAAVLCWGLSFFAGCCNRQRYTATLMANHYLLQVMKNPAQADDPDHDAKVGAFRDSFETLKANARASNRWATAQFWLLVIGAMLFLTWHILEMKGTVKQTTQQTFQQAPRPVP